MKSFIKIILFLSLPFCVRSQQNLDNETQRRKNELDSLKQADLKNATNDTLRMGTYAGLAYYYMGIQRDSGLYCAEQALLLAKKLKLRWWEAFSYDAAGILNELGNYSKSLQYLLKGIKIAENPETEKGIWNLTSFNKDARAARLFVLSQLHHNMGYLYDQTGNLRQAISQYFEAIKIAEEVNDEGSISLNHLTLGGTYLKMNLPDSAIIYEKKRLSYINPFPVNPMKGLCLLVLGKAYLLKGNKTLAKKYLDESIQVGSEEKSFKFLADANLSKANLYKDEGVIDSSLWYAKKSLQIYQATGSPAGMADAYTSLSLIYKLRNKADSAFIFQSLASATKDSIYNAEKIKQFEAIGFNEQLRLQQLEKEKIQVQQKIKTYALLAGLGVFLIIALILYRNNRQKQKANALLQQQKEKVESTLQELKATQAQLIQSEKMASLGELTAGIAHEIQNPLNFVNNFSEVNTELIVELEEEANKGNIDEIKSIAKDIKENEQKIIHHGKRADAIVKGMLQHSRVGTGQKEPTDINTLADEYLRLSYHGMRAKDKTFNAEIKTDFDSFIGKINIVPQDIGRVLLNLYNNAFYAVQEKQKTTDEKFQSTVSITTKKLNDKVEIRVADNGNGIPQKVLDKIFQPFFTTKPTGQGTGLGLSLAYDIVKAHGGEIKVKTEEDEGAEFIIILNE